MCGLSKRRAAYQGGRKAVYCRLNQADSLPINRVLIVLENQVTVSDDQDTVNAGQVSFDMSVEFQQKVGIHSLFFWIGFTLAFCLPVVTRGDWPRLTADAVAREEDSDGEEESRPSSQLSHVLFHWLIVLCSKDLSQFDSNTLMVLSSVSMATSTVRAKPISVPSALAVNLTL